MTVGELSRRTGVPVKSLRQYTGWSLVNTVGRSATNHRQYTSEASASSANCGDSG